MSVREYFIGVDLAPVRDHTAIVIILFLHILGDFGNLSEPASFLNKFGWIEREQPPRIVVSSRLAA